MSEFIVHNPTVGRTFPCFSTLSITELYIDERRHQNLLPIYTVHKIKGCLSSQHPHPRGVASAAETFDL